MRYFRHALKDNEERNKPLDVSMRMEDFGRVVSIAVEGAECLQLRMTSADRVYVTRCRPDEGLPPNVFKTASDGGIWTVSTREEP
jgi:hypothetical protein